MRTPIPEQGPEQGGIASPGGEVEAEGLRLAIGSLSAWARTSETDVLAVGEALQSFHMQIRTALDAMERLGQAMLDEGGEEAIRTLGRAVEEAAGLESFQTQSLNELGQLGTSTARALSGSATTARLLRQLTHLAIIVRTNVCASQTTLDALGGFAEEVTSLIENGRETATELARQLDAMDRALATGRPIRRPEMNAHSQAIREVAHRLGSVGSRLLAQRKSTSLGIAEANRRFAAVWRAIGDVVQSLQFHDIARQRLEHALAGIERLLQVREVGRLTSDGDSLPEDQCNLAVVTIAALEATHLEALARDCEREFDSLRSNLRAIASTLHEAQIHFASLYGGKGETQSSALAELNGELAAVATAFAAEERAREALHQAMESCVAKAEPLGGIILALSDFEQELRLSGLNAVIRSAKLEGGNQAIRCISHELRDEALAVKQEAEAVRANVEEALKAARRLSDEILPGIKAGRSALHAGLNDAAAILCRIESQARAHHTTAQAAAHALPAAIERLAESVRPEVEGVPEMRKTASILRRLAENAPEVPKAAIWPELEDMLHQPYTMARERALHRTAMGLATSPSPAAPSKEAAADDDLSDILF